MEMNFILQLRRFDELSIGNLNPNAIAIYYHLFMTNNRCGWKEWFSESDLWIEQAVGISRRETVLNAINLLKQKGFIDFERGTRKGQPTKYKILPLLNSAKDSGKDSGCDSSYPSGYDSGKDSGCDSDNPKYKHKPKNKNIYTPEFEKIWSVYPRHDGKAEAQKAFDKLKPSEELITVMLSAIEKQKQSEKWQSDGGKFIPHCKTWLNQRRWEDEGVVLQETPALSAEEKAARDRQRAEEDAAFEAAERERLKKEYDIVYDEDGKLAV